MALLITLRLGQMAAREAFDSPSTAPVAQDVFLGQGGSGSVAAKLTQMGVIRHPLIFRLAVFATRHEGPLRQGEYRLPARASIAEILGILRHGPQVEHQITIPEGLTAVQITALLNAAPLATGQVAAVPEGSVLPQTYDYLWNTQRGAILLRAQAALRASLDAAWASRDPQVDLASPQAALILASIVQSEAKLTSEMPHIASVYENRLNQGMKLQADPTVIYAASEGRVSGGAGISRADLANPSPYNTYAHAGLPPGPICAAGLEAIQAVLHPAASSDLYFVANGTGGHIFSRSFADQLRAIKKYRELVN